MFELLLMWACLPKRMLWSKWHDDCTLSEFYIRADDRVWVNNSRKLSIYWKPGDDGFPI
jgi:hypothetical protein